MDTSELQKMYEYERHKLNSLCEKWQKISDNSTRRSHSEDTKGAILAVLGQSRLLLNKKLKQFEQLLADPEGTTADMPPITLSDLEGFWEVVMIQRSGRPEELSSAIAENQIETPVQENRRITVNDVYTKFADLEKSNVSGNEGSRTSKPSVDKSQRSANLYSKRR